MDSRPSWGIKQKVPPNKKVMTTQVLLGYLRQSWSFHK